MFNQLAVSSMVMMVDGRDEDVDVAVVVDPEGDGYGDYDDDCFSDHGELGCCCCC